MNRVVIGLGSNIEPERNIENALAELSQHLKIVSKSEFIITEPVGIKNQPDFMNGAVLVETDLEKGPLKTLLRAIEAGLGRTKEKRSFGPRTIDLDIVVWNNEIVDNDFYERDFLREATLELLPDLKY